MSPDDQPRGSRSYPLPSVAAGLIAAGLSFWLASGVFVSLQVILVTNLLSFVEPYLLHAFQKTLLERACSLAAIAVLPLMGYLVWRVSHPALRWLLAPVGRLLPGLVIRGRRIRGGLPKGAILRRLGRVGRGLWRAYLVGGLLFLGLQALTSLRIAWAVTTNFSAAVATRDTCTKCHSLNNLLAANRTNAVWDIIVDRDLELLQHQTGEEVDLKTRQSILSLLYEVRGYPDDRLLGSKCFTCHSPWGLFDRARSPREWAEITDRIQRRHPYFITWRQRDQIATLLAARHGVQDGLPDRPWSMQQQEIFEHKCGVCHTLDIAILPWLRADGWPEVLKRMGGKEPEMLSPEEALSIEKLVRALPRDPKAFRHLFPHASMPEWDSLARSRTLAGVPGETPL